MKYLLFSIALILASCDKKEPCESCQLTLVNNNADYDYIMEFGNWPGGPVGLHILPGETKKITLPAGRLVNIKGDFQSPYAHNNYIGVAKCDEDCGPILQIMEQ